MFLKNNTLYAYLIGLIFILFTTFVVYTLTSHISENKKFTLFMIEEKAKIYFENIVVTRKWNTIHGGVFVKKKENLEPNPYLEDNHILSENGELLIKINPAWMTRQISEINNVDNKVQFKITSLNPLNPLNKPDKFEKEALEYFEKNREEKFYSLISDDLSKFDFVGALKVTESCLKCHGKQGYKLGDTRGGIRVSIPTKEYLSGYNKTKSEHENLIGIISIMSILIIGFYIWFVIKLNKGSIKIKNNFEEISSLKKSNDELLSRYEYAVDGTKDGLWDWNLETNEVFFSKRWKNMLGFEDYEIKNSLEEWDIRIHPDDKENTIKDIKDNQNKLTTYYQNIHRLRHKDGTWLWILDRGRTYFNKDGKPIRMLGFHSNITEFKNLEIRLDKTQQELKQLKMVIENAPSGIVITDTKGDISYINPRFCEVSGYKKNELLRQNTKKIMLKEKEDFEKYKELCNAITNKETWGGIFKNKNKEGREYWVTITVLPILDSKDEIINYLGITREITKEVYLEKALKEKEELMLYQSKNAAMGEMISMIAHQWRQPITTISMNANNIIADIELETVNEEELKNIANNIAFQTQFLSKTIDDFRNFFKEDKEVSKVSIKEVFDELSSIMMASLKNNDVEFNIKYNDYSLISTYKRELLQVILNIVKNAKEALIISNIENRYINVEVNKDSDDIEICIEDNAGGISDECIEKVFEPYFTTKEQFNGTGLGLYMSKMIVEKHLNGSLKVFNSDNGAVFVIKIKDLK